MNRKFKLLQELKNGLNSFEVLGIENIKNKRTIIVANHSHINDIFYVAMALDRVPIIMISSKTYFEKREEMEKYIYGMPIEIRYKNYTKICMIEIVDLMKKIEDAILIVFAEGAYDNDRAVYKGRTGAIQILFELKDLGLDVDLIPISLERNIQDEIINNNIKLTISKKIDIEKEYINYRNSLTKEEKNVQLHKVIDKALKIVAFNLNLEYKDEYLELYKRDFIPLPDKTFYVTTNKNDDTYIDIYQDFLINQKNIIIESQK